MMSVKPAARAPSAVRRPTANTGSPKSSCARGCRSSARIALRLVTMMPVQGPAPRSTFGTASTRSKGATTTSWPRVRKAAAVRSPSGSGRVTRSRTQITPQRRRERDSVAARGRPRHARPRRGASLLRQARIAPHDLAMLGRSEAGWEYTIIGTAAGSEKLLLGLPYGIGRNLDGCARDRDDLR